MNIKSKIVAVAFFATALLAQAQPVPAALFTPSETSVSQVPNLIPNDPQTFVQSFSKYFTTINTNYTWVSNRLEFSVGAGQTGPILANYVAAQYDIGLWDVGAQIRNAGIGGVIETAELGGGYTLIRSGDVKLQASLLAGYDFDKSAGIFEPQFVLRKKGTQNTYFEAGVCLPEWTKGPLNKTPSFFLGTGFSY